MSHRYSFVKAGLTQYPPGTSIRRRNQRRCPPSATAALPVGLLTPILSEGAQSRLGQQAPARNPARAPRCDGMRLVRGQDAPVKAVCSARKSVSDDSARLAFRIDEQLGTRTDATPLRCRVGRPALAAAQFTGISPEVFVLLHAERHPPQPGGLWGSGGRPPVTHRLALQRFSGDGALRRSSRQSTASAAKRSAIAMPEATEGSGRVATNPPWSTDKRSENTQNLLHISVNSPLPVAVLTERW